MHSPNSTLADAEVFPGPARSLGRTRQSSDMPAGRNNGSVARFGGPDHRAEARGSPSASSSQTGQSARSTMTGMRCWIGVAGGSPRIASLPQSGEAAPPGEGVAEHWVRPMLLGCPVGGRGNTGNLSRVRHLVALNVGPFTKDVRVPRPWPRLRSGLREAGIVPNSNLAPPAEPDAMCAVRSCSWLLLALAGCAGQPQQASAPGPSLAPNDDAAPCSQVGMRALVSRGLEGPRRTAGSGGRAPQPAIWHACAGHSHRNRAGHRGA